MGSFAHGGDDMMELTHCCGGHVTWIGGIKPHGGEQHGEIVAE